MRRADSVASSRYYEMTCVVVFAVLVVSSSVGSIDSRIGAPDPVRIESASAKAMPEPLTTDELIQEMLSHD